MLKKITCAQAYLIGFVSVFIIPKRFFNRIMYSYYELSENDDGIDFNLDIDAKITKYKDSDLVTPYNKD